MTPFGQAGKVAALFLSIRAAVFQILRRHGHRTNLASPALVEIRTEQSHRQWRGMSMNSTSGGRSTAPNCTTASCGHPARSQETVNELMP